MAGVEKHVKSRKFQIQSLDETIGFLNAEVGKESPDRQSIEAKMIVLEKLESVINDLNAKIWNKLLDTDLLDPIYEAERATVIGLENKISAIKVAVHHVMAPAVVPEPGPSEAGSSRSTQGGYKLPKIEIKKFSGEYTDWLSWWTQFQKIHENGDLDPSDKFQYLVQSIEPGTRAHSIVSSYPITDKNYAEVIEVLKKRFGNKTILVEIYVRKLLKMVVASAQAKKKRDLSSLYDELESNLRALRTLGVEAENSAAFLYPLVESSLPEEIIQVWQRCGSFSTESRGPGVDESWLKHRLTKLMEFLGREVENAERLEFVKQGFEKENNQSESSDSESEMEETPSRAAFSLFSGGRVVHQKKTGCCIFCHEDHSSSSCLVGKRMSQEERVQKVMESRTCFACFLPGHISKNCEAEIQCAKCQGKHLDFMCNKTFSSKPVGVRNESKDWNGGHVGPRVGSHGGCGLGHDGSITRDRTSSGAQKVGEKPYGYSQQKKNSHFGIPKYQSVVPIQVEEVLFRKDGAIHSVLLKSEDGGRKLALVRSLVIEPVPDLEMQSSPVFLPGKSSGVSGDGGYG